MAVDRDEPTGAAVGWAMASILVALVMVTAGWLIVMGGEAPRDGGLAGAGSAHAAVWYQEPVTATATLTATLAAPTRTPAPHELDVLLAVGEGRMVHAYRQPLAEPGATWAWFMTIEGEWIGGRPLAYGYRYLLDVPGATMTIEPTDTETPPPEPTQTPWIVVVTETPAPTASPTATSTPVRVHVPWAWKPRVRR